MVKKKVDSRIRDLIENGAKTRERSMFIVVGDRARFQLPNLQMLLGNATDNKYNKKILWAYKKDLGFTTHGGKRDKKIKRDIKQGKRDPNSADPFELFLTTQKIEYCYYKESERILGNTFGMCILQDFEALTPNTLARTIETVEGGGIIVLMLKSMSSLKQLYTLSMDIYSRYRTEAHSDVVGRFNERFLLSLRSLDQNSLIIDDEMNVLPALGERHIRQAKTVEREDSDEYRKLQKTVEDLEGVQPAQALVSLAKTNDQATAILQFLDSIAEKTLRNTVAMTAGRGRGKSAALGIAIAAAVAHGYSNIFITSPSPENLKTLFEFVFIGLTELNYTEGHDYDIFKSTNPAYNNSVVRVNIFKSNHRQTIQYIAPEDSKVLGQAELVVIDEAAAIPLPLVRNLLGPYLVFMASTINGYEGTGRSLSLKLIKQLREQQTAGKEGMSGRQLREVALKEPIRYAPGDRIEKWLNNLLCLNATIAPRNKGLPNPGECTLFHVNRDSLFSYHQTSESFLHKVWALFVSSHYKNSPNDLQLLSDAPAHQLFVLLGPVTENKIPDPLCVIQVVLEGEISKESIASSLSKGRRGDGDLIPWAISQQFQDHEFATLSGARVLRIATNPEFQGMGYGSKALELLKDYYTGKMQNLSEEIPLSSATNEEVMTRVSDKEISKSSLETEELKPRDASKLPALLKKLDERTPERLDYLGVSFGLSKELLKFWRRGKFAPVYLRQTKNDLTGEHSCIMIHVLENRQGAWLGDFTADFHKRYLHLLAYGFKEFEIAQAMNILSSAKEASTPHNKGLLKKSELDELFSPYDLKRLNSYARNALDYHVIVDMLPTIAQLVFNERLGSEVLSSLQNTILLGIGLQKKSLEEISSELNVPVSQAIGIFGKILKRVYTVLDSIEKQAVGETIAEARDDQLDEMEGVEQQINTGYVDDNINDKESKEEDEEEEEEEDEEDEDEDKAELKRKQRDMIDSLDLSKYAIPGDWDEQAAQKAAKSGGRIALKSDKAKKRKENANDIVDEELGSSRKNKKAKKSRK